MDLNSIARFPNFNLAINLSTSDICYTYPQALIGTIKKKKWSKSPRDPLFFIIYINKTNASELKMERTGQKEAMN